MLPTKYVLGRMDMVLGQLETVGRNWTLRASLQRGIIKAIVRFPSRVLRGLVLKPRAKIKLQPPSVRSMARDIQRLEWFMRLSSTWIVLIFSHSYGLVHIYLYDVKSMFYSSFSNMTQFNRSEIHNVNEHRVSVWMRGGLRDIMSGSGLSCGNTRPRRWSGWSTVTSSQQWDARFHVSAGQDAAATDTGCLQRDIGAII